MDPGDYMLGLLTIVTGLAITDMIVSLHGLLINRKHVRWDWLALLVAAFVLILIINTWRMTFVAAQGTERGPEIWIFLLILIPLTALYLAARAALPDRVELGATLDLGEHYAFVARYLWSALATLYGGVLVLGLIPLLSGRDTDLGPVFTAGLIGFPVVLSLAIWPNRKLHRVLVPLLFIWLCARVLPARLLAT